MPSLGSLYWTIRGDTDALDADVAKSAQQLGRSLQSQGQTLTRGLTVPLVAFAAAGSKAFQDVNKGLREVVTLTGQAGAEADATFDSFRGQVAGLSSELGVAQTELVDGLYSALSAGVPQENVFSFLETATKAGIAGVATTEEAVDGITSAINAFGLEFTEADRVADVFFSTVRNGKTTLSELSSSIGKIAPIANLVGVSVEEVGAALSTLTANGLNTAEATTQIRASLTALTRPTENMVAVFQDLGFESAQAAIEQEGLQFALKAVFDSANGDVGALTALLGTQEAVGATALIAGSAQEKFAADLEAAANSAGAASLAFDQIDEARGIERAINDIRALAIEIGAALAPAVEGAAEVLGKIVAVLERIPAGALAAFGGIVAAIGPAQIVLGKFIASGEAGVGVGARLGAAFTKIASPAGLAVVAVGAVVAGVLEWQAAAARAEERAETYAAAVAEVEGANDAAQRAIDAVSGSVDEQAAAFEAATGAGAGFLAILDGIVASGDGDSSELESLIERLNGTGVTNDDLGAIGAGTATVEQVGRYTQALEALREQGLVTEAAEVQLGLTLDATGKAADLAAKNADALARAQLDLALDAGIISQREATLIGIRAELAAETGSLAEFTEQFFTTQERLNETYGDTFALLGPGSTTMQGFADSTRNLFETIGPGSNTLDGFAGAIEAVSSTASGLGAILSVDIPADIAAFTAAAAAGAEAGRAAFGDAINGIREEFGEALSLSLEVDTDNGVNDVQDAINNITGAVGTAEESLQILDDRVAAIERLKELGPTIGTEFENVIGQIAAGAGDGLLDDILFGEGGTDIDLLGQLEESLAGAEALRIKLEPDEDQAALEAFSESFAASFTATASEGLAEFTAEIEAANPEVETSLDTTEADTEFDRLIKDITDANPVLGVQVSYEPTGPIPDVLGITGDIPGFMFGGPVPPNTVARVGEVRPELIQTDAAGRAYVVPNTSALQETGSDSNGGISIGEVNIAEAEASGDPGNDLARALYMRGF